MAIKVFIEEGCPFCKNFLEVINQVCHKCDFKIVNISKDSEGLKEADKLGLNSVPTAVKENGEIVNAFEALKECLCEVEK